MLPNPETRSITLNDYLRVVKRRARLIIVLLVGIPSITALIVFSMTPVYRATASILIERSPLKITNFEDVRQPDSRGFLDTRQYYQTQHGILASRMLAEHVFEELRLGSEKEFRGEKDPVQKLIDNIKIDPVRDSQIVLVNADSTNALRASLIANALAMAYIQQDVENRKLEAKEAAEWLETQLGGIRKKRQEAEEALNRYVQENKIVTTVSPDIENKIKSLLENLKDSRAKTEIELAESLKRYKERHPKIIALRADLEDLNNKIEKETSLMLDLSQKMVQYNLLKKETESSQELYNQILTRVKETSISGKLETTIARIIDPARIPDIPDRPKKLLAIVISLFIALTCGVSAAFLMEYIKSAIYTAEDVGTYLSLPFLGYVSSVGRHALTDAERDLICHKKPDSIIAEAYRKAIASIIFASPEDKPLKSILVTSAIPKEGSASAAISIATIFSQANERVILLDVTMQNLRMYKSLGLEPKPGLSDFLTGNAKLEEIVRPTIIKDLSIITSGTISPNMGGLLSSGKVQSLLKVLMAKFDRIILNCPPVLSAADSSLLANITDGVVFIIRGGHTHLNNVIRAKDAILKARGNIIGVLVNNIDIIKEDRYYYRHYYKK